MLQKLVRCSALRKHCLLIPPPGVGGIHSEFEDKFVRIRSFASATYTTSTFVARILNESIKDSIDLDPSKPVFEK